MKPLTKTDAFYIFAMTVFVALFMSALLSLSPNRTPAHFWSNQVAYSVSLLLAPYVYCSRRGIAVIPPKALVKKPRLPHLLFLFATIFFLVNGMVNVNEWILDLFEKLGLNRPTVSITPDVILEAPLTAIFVVCIVAPVAEEIIFRGLVVRGLAEGKKLPAILLGGALFSLFHMNPAQTLHQFLVGCILAAIAIDAGTITAIIGHIFNNALALVLALTVEPAGFYESNAAWVTAVGLAGFAATIVFFVLWHRRRVPPAPASANPPKPTPMSKIALAVAVAGCTTMWGLSLFSL
jgi:membrane protease YdiL (CAAX protease family)